MNYSEFAFSTVLALLVSAFLSGCDNQALTVKSPSVTELSIGKSIDLGIVFANENNYVAFPLSKFGIPNDSKIVSVKSSCDCVVPIVVGFGTAIQMNQALKLELKSDGKSDDQLFNPITLCVEIRVSLAAGTTETIQATFLYAKVLDSQPWKSVAERRRW